jgi:fatty-acyl-CoA synthase
MTENLVNVGNWIRQWSTIRPNATAIISDDVPFTYLELDKRINRLARFLLSAGIRKGDRVATLLHNRKEYIEIFFALSKLGAIIVPLNWRLTVSEIEFILRDSGTKMVFFEPEFTQSIDALRAQGAVNTCIECIGPRASAGTEIPPWAVEYEGSIGSQMDTEPAIKEQVGDADPHIIMYTSGTTGQPKGAVLSHRKTFFNVLNSDMFFDLTTKDIMIIARPMFHSGGLIVESAPVLYKGGTIVVKRRFSPIEILETVQRYKVTLLELPATVYQFILNQCHIENYDLRSIRCCFTGGERVPVHLLKELAERGIVVSQIYGLTEASTLFWLPTEEAREKMGSVGHPIFHGKVKIVDKEGNSVKPGQTGEVTVKGPIVMSGYWGRPDLTNEVIKDGWLHTGDLARTDDEGFVFIMDRSKDMFISGGENVYPAEIEKVLLSHPEIADAAVVGVDDDKWGEVGKAFVVVKDNGTMAEESITAFLTEHLAKYKIPKYIEFMDELPKTASGKIQKYLLKKGSRENAHE